MRGLPAISFFFMSLFLPAGVALHAGAEFNAALYGLPKVEKSESGRGAGAGKKTGGRDKSSQVNPAQPADSSAGKLPPVQKRPKSEFAGSTGEMAADASPMDEYPNVVRVSDFGAVPGDGLDDSDAIRRAIASAEGKSGVRVVFEVGTYDLFTFERGYAGVFAGNFDKIMIDGCGATLVLHSGGSQLVFEKCSDVVVRNIDFECAEYPFAGGVVTDVGDEYFDCSVGEGQNILELVPKAVNLYDIRKNEFIPGLDIYQKVDKSVENLGGGKMRVPLDKGGAKPNKGDEVVVRYQVYGPPAVSFSECWGVRMYNVNVWGHSGTGIHAQASSGVSLDNVNVIPKNDAVLMTTTADAVQFRNCRGDLRVSNCRFERCGGDALSVHQMYWVVSERVDAHVVKLKYGKARAGFDLKAAPRKGDMLDFGSDENGLRPGFRSEVVSVEVDEREKFLLVELSRALPGRVDKGAPVSNASAQPDLVVERTSAVSTRARGFAVLARSVKIENCEFISTLYPAIIMECDSRRWFEGAAIESASVSGCLFVDCNRVGVKSGASVCDGAKFSESTPSEGWVHNSIRVQNCRFKSCSESPVLLDFTLNPATKSNALVN